MDIAALYRNDKGNGRWNAYLRTSNKPKRLDEPIPGLKCSCTK